VCASLAAGFGVPRLPTRRSRRVASDAAAVVAVLGASVAGLGGYPSGARLGVGGGCSAAQVRKRTASFGRDWRPERGGGAGAFLRGGAPGFLRARSPLRLLFLLVRDSGATCGRDSWKC
jgi:hypothetical protein